MSIPGFPQVKYGLHHFCLQDALPQIVQLKTHPLLPGHAAHAVEVEVALPDDGGLLLRYRVTGLGIRLPVPCSPTACDGLWQHTCCEAFIAEGGGAAYRECNFSPSGAWAAYRFSGYRERDPDYRAPLAPEIEVQEKENGFMLAARLSHCLLPADARVRLGLSVVLEMLDGSKAYWALAHVASQPDFHLRDSFSLVLDPEYS